MTIGKTPALAALSARLHWEAENTKIATDNLSRANVPNAVEKTLQPFRFADTLNHGNALRMTQKNHMKGTAPPSTYKIKENKSEGEMDATSNNISPEQELMTLNESAIQTTVLTTMAKSLLSNYRMILTVSK